MKNFLHMLESFGKKEDVKKFANAWLLEDPIQKIDALTCGSFQLYLYENLFFPGEKTRLYSYKKLTSQAMETLLNKLSTLDRDKIEQIINKYINERQIKMS